MVKFQSCTMEANSAANKVSYSNIRYFVIVDGCIYSYRMAFKLCSGKWLKCLHQDLLCLGTNRYKPFQNIRKYLKIVFVSSLVLLEPLTYVLHWQEVVPSKLQNMEVLASIRHLVGCIIPLVSVFLNGIIRL